MIRSLVIALCGLFLLTSGICLAAVPYGMTVQGKVTDAAGAPLPAGPKTFTFRIYNDSTLGTRIWPNAPAGEIQSITTNVDGLWVGRLGEFHHFSEAVFADTVQWLEINVDGTTLPRVRLLTGPYAFRVRTVDGATGGVVGGDLSVSAGNLNLDSSSETAGNILKGGQPFIHDYGARNIFVGRNAGNLTMTGTGYNTAIGFNSFRNNIDGNYNTASGFEALLSNTEGDQNTAIGAVALGLNTTGSYNTAVGVIALGENVSGDWNTAFGRAALGLNTVGDNNTAIGTGALYSNEDGHDNTATGMSALESNTSGYDNTAAGRSALYSNSTGRFNTASGSYALYSNTFGESNTANGYEALKLNETGTYNTACGSAALLNNSDGFRNTAIGTAALAANTIGDYNTAGGVSALGSNTTGDSNTACGTFALTYNTTGDYNTATGAHALFNNTTGEYNSASGMGALLNNTDGIFNSAMGVSALSSNTSGDLNAACGAGALNAVTTGGRNTAIGASANVSSGGLFNATAIGYGAVVDASNKIRLGDGSVTVICGQVAFTACSDKNLKENFEPVDGDEVLRKIRDLSLTSWNYKGHDPEHFRHYGPVAQEFYAAFGHDRVGACGDSTSINSGDQAGILMIAVQALERRNQELEATVTLLNSRLEKLEQK